MDTGTGSETVHDNSLKRPYLGETPRVPPVSLARRSPAACNNTLYDEIVPRATRGTWILRAVAGRPENLLSAQRNMDGDAGEGGRGERSSFVVSSRGLGVLSPSLFALIYCSLFPLRVESADVTSGKETQRFLRPFRYDTAATSRLVNLIGLCRSSAEY